MGLYRSGGGGGGSGGCGGGGRGGGGLLGAIGSVSAGLRQLPLHTHQLLLLLGHRRHGSFGAVAGILSGNLRVAVQVDIESKT
jgi:hypothetical protein